MKKINPFLVLNVDMKLPRQKDCQCQPDRINLADNNLEVLPVKMMILVHITHGKVSLDYVPKNIQGVLFLRGKSLLKSWGTTFLDQLTAIIYLRLIYLKIT